jgi:hypothetical protein
MLSLVIGKTPKKALNRPTISQYFEQKLTLFEHHISYSCTPRLSQHSQGKFLISKRQTLRMLGQILAIHVFLQI